MKVADSERLAEARDRRTEGQDMCSDATARGASGPLGADLYLAKSADIDLAIDTGQPRSLLTEMGN